MILLGQTRSRSAVFDLLIYLFLPPRNVTAYIARFRDMTLSRSSTRASARHSRRLLLGLLRTAALPQPDSAQARRGGGWRSGGSGGRWGNQSSECSQSAVTRKQREQSEFVWATL